MALPRPAPRILVRYLLFQLPSWVLLLLAAILVREWVNLPSWVLWVAIAVWFAKDLLFFAFVWRAYDRSPRGPAEVMVGTQGIAEERLNPAGYVRI